MLAQRQRHQATCQQKSRHTIQAHNLVKTYNKQTNTSGPVALTDIQGFLFVPAAAYFMVEKETFTTAFGGAALLECRAYGDLPITATWFYKDWPLKEGAYDRLAFQPQILPDGFRSSLKISRSQRGDSGSYACKVENEFRSATKQIQVHSPASTGRTESFDCGCNKQWNGKCWVDCRLWWEQYSY